MISRIAIVTPIMEAPLADPATNTGDFYGLDDFCGLA
jgi:hypothetical protein